MKTDTFGFRTVVTLSALLFGVLSSPKPHLGISQGCNFSVTIAAPTTLESLSDSSQLIVEGIVDKVYPATNISPVGARDKAETDFEFRVNQVLKGTLSKGSIIVSQTGGALNGAGCTTRQYSMVEAGQHYMLFLFPTPTAVPARPDRDGMPRFKITAEFAGLLLVDSANVAHWSAGMPKAWKDSYDGVGIQSIKSRIAEHNPKR